MNIEAPPVWVRLAYGRDGLDVELPAQSVVVAPRHDAPIGREPTALRNALRAPIGAPPLQRRVAAGDRVTVVHSDITRPMPNDRVLPVLVDELKAGGVRAQDITLLCGLGSHRSQTPAEMETLLGRELLGQVRCLQHDAWDAESLVTVRADDGSGRSWHISRHYLEADVRIVTGFIEPHFFAGFSGGPKAVLPGVAGLDSILRNHGPDMICHEQATWGITDGNPIWEDMQRAARSSGPCFQLNVTLDDRRRITGVFAGDLDEAHRAGCRACRASAMAPVPHAFDVVVTSNGGHPLDLNLYQSVKGLSAAAQIVRPGGAIVMATACADGMPEHGSYARILSDAASPDDALRTVTAPGFSGHDGWQVQIQARIQARAEVHVFSDGLTDRQLKRAHMTPCRDVGDTVRRLALRTGKDATIAVLPRGPLTIPYVDASA